jgi:hypothetical protein
MPLNLSPIEEGITKLQELLLGHAAQRKKLLTDSMYSDSYKAQLLAEADAKAEKAYADLLAGMKQEVADQLEAAAKKAKPKNPTPEELAQRTYMAAIAGQVLNGLDTEAMVNRLGEMVAEGRDPVLLREAMQLVELKMDRSPLANMDRDQLAAIRYQLATPEQREVMALSAAGNAVLDKLAQVEAFSSPFLQRMKAGEPTTGMDLIVNFTEPIKQTATQAEGDAMTAGKA